MFYCLNGISQTDRNIEFIYLIFADDRIDPVGERGDLGVNGRVIGQIAAPVPRNGTDQSEWVLENQRTSQVFTTRTDVGRTAFSAHHTVDDHRRSVGLATDSGV
jgi:hypothetical protein